MAWECVTQYPSSKNQSFMKRIEVWGTLAHGGLGPKYFSAICFDILLCSDIGPAWLLVDYDTYDWLDDWRTTYVRVVRPAGERSTDLDHRSWTRARLTSRSKIQMCNACPAHYLLLCVEVKGTRVLNEYSMMNIEYFIPMMNLNYESSIHLRQRKRERHHLSGNNASEKVNTTYSYRSYILQYSNWSSLYLTRTKKDVYPWLLQYLRY